MEWHPGSQMQRRIQGRVFKKTVFVNAAGLATWKGKVKTNGKLLGLANIQAPVIRARSDLASRSKRLFMISPEETQQAICKLVETSLAIHPEAVVAVSENIWLCAV